MNWLKIAEYLDSENYTKIHVLNRAQIINDAFSFMISHKMDPTVFMEITKYLRRETEYIVWYPILRNLREVVNLYFYNQKSELLNVSKWFSCYKIYVYACRKENFKEKSLRKR